MNRSNLTWRFLFVVFVVAWALWSIYPPQSPNLIDVFEERAVTRGDTNLVALRQAIVEDARRRDAASPTRTFLNLREAIGTNDVLALFPGIKVADHAEPNRALLHKLQEQSAGKIKLGLDLQGGTSFLMQLKPPDESGTNEVRRAEERAATLDQAVEVLRKRVDKFGVAEPIIQPAGDNQILVQLPGLSEADKEEAKANLQKAAFLEFRLVHPQSAQLVQQGLTPPNHVLLRTTRKDRSGQEMIEQYIVKKRAEKNLTGAYVARAFVTPHELTGKPEIILRFNTEGAAIFADVTRENVGRQLAIVLDGELASAPSIREPITGGSASISGDYTWNEAMKLANVLENPLESPLELLEERSVEPSLGKDNIMSGITASIVGTAAVAIFMLVYYLFAGFVANVALILNLVILLGVMCSVGTTLTLPGIAGVVLTVGMAVDANVLIYERIREELNKGKSLRGALTAGYDRAFSTIFDSHVTTLIASVILIFMGTGPIKGFGVALTIGVAASLFTALVVTRIIFDFWHLRGWLTNLRMLHLIGKTSIDFMKFARPAFIASWMLIVIGIGFGFYRGKSLWGVEFSGGDSLTMSFEQTLNTEQYRDRVAATIAQAGVRDAIVQFQEDFRTGAKTLRVTTPIDEGAKAAEALKAQLPEAKFQTLALDKMGATVGKSIQKAAIISVLLSLFGILIYVALRYEFSFAIAAIVAVLHDVLMTIGWYCLTGLFGEGRQFNATTVAALLTIIGFSMNDTIVIFDRIREDLKLGVRGSFRDIINHALNQTLSRTIITSGTVFLSTLSLYLFGGGAINDFAFTFLIGILTGTYSSIYIAGTFVLWWHKGERPALGANQVALEGAVPAGA